MRQHGTFNERRVQHAIGWKLSDWRTRRALKFRDLTWPGVSAIQCGCCLALNPKRPAASTIGKPSKHCAFKSGETHGAQRSR